MDVLTRGTGKMDRRGPGGRETGSDTGGLGTLKRVAGTLASRWKLLVPLWLAISAVLVTLIFLLPREYSRSVTLAVTPVQSELQARLGQSPPDAAQIKSRASTLLEQANLGPISADPQYDPARPQEPLKVQTESRNRRALADVGPKLVAAVEEGFAEAQEVGFANTIRAQIASLNGQAATQEGSLRALDKQIELIQPAGPEDVKTVVRLAVFETQRQTIVTTIDGLNAQKQVFEADLQNLSELADDPIDVKVASETPVRQDNLRVPAAAFAVLLGFVAAAGAVLWVAARSK